MKRVTTSKFDAVFRSLLLQKFFTKGWGKPENLRRLFEFRKVVSNRDECYKLIERDYPVTITKEQTLSDCKIVEGYFMSPLERYLPGIVPEVAQKAHFQALMPLHWPQPGVKPMCLHLAGTGDHFFWRRRNLMVKPLLKEAAIGGIILENPFYGLRKPTDQVRSSLHNVSDIFVMGGCLILESLVMFHWCMRNGLGPLGVTGLSMGGHGVMSHSINWDLLEDQYLSDGAYREKLSKMVTIVDEAFLAGKKFARTYSQTVDNKTVTPNSKTLDEHFKKSLDVATILTNGPKKTDPDIVVIPKNVLLDKNVVRADMFTQMEQLNKELKILRNHKQISKKLYKKLISNEKFELDVKDIEEINKLSEGSLIKDLLLKCNVAEAKKNEKKEPTEEPTPGPPSGKSRPPAPAAAPAPAPAPEPAATASAHAHALHTASSALAPSPDKSVAIKKSWNVSDITSDFWMNLPFMRSGKKIDISKIHWRDREALQFMRGIMDECTHLSNFSIPYDTSLIIAVCAQHDAYVPREDVGALEEIWPGAEVRYVDAGHVSAYILHQSLFRSVHSILRALEEIWPGAEVRYVDAGHVSAYILHQSLFRNCVIEAFERSKKKWKNGKHINEPDNMPKV